MADLIEITFQVEINGKEEEGYKIRFDPDKADIKVGVNISKCQLK